MVQTEKRLLWHPRLDNRFLVGFGSQLSLYEWHSDSSEIRHVTSKHDLQMMRCFAWSPEVLYDDFVAVGYSTGKVDLARLEATASAPSQILSSGPTITLPVRNTRACNALAFCPIDSNYLAVGLDKVRGDSSLVIWDINTVIPSLSVRLDSHHSSSNTSGSGSFIHAQSRPHPILPRAEVGTRTDPRVLQQHAPAEIVSSVSWLPKSTHLFLAGVSHRWLRLFDLRSNTPLVANIASKVHGIATDPFDQHRVGCWGDGGVANIWDIRSLAHPMLTFTEKDAVADGGGRGPRGAGASSSSSTGEILAMEFSSVRRGMVATLEKDANHVRFWNLQKVEVSGGSGGAHGGRDGRMSRESSHSSRATRLSWANPTNMLPWASSTGGTTHGPPAVTPPDAQKVTHSLVLSDTRKTKNFSRSLASFALVPSADLYPLTSNVMVVNREGDLELYAVYDTATHPPWSPRGDLTMGIGRSYRILHGFRSRFPPPEPWDILTQPSMPTSAAHSVNRLNLAPGGNGNGRELQSATTSSGARSFTNQKHHHSASPPPTFGRGDEDGFPALPSLSAAAVTASAVPKTANLAATRPTAAGGGRTFSPAALRSLHFDHSTFAKQHHGGSGGGGAGVGVGPGFRSSASAGEGADNHHGNHSNAITGVKVKHGRHGRDSSARGRTSDNRMQSTVEGDISMIMRHRVLEGYGLINPLHNSTVSRYKADNFALSELWFWIHHAQQLLSVPTSEINGYNFSYCGIQSIWEGFRPSRLPYSAQPTPLIPHRSLLLDTTLPTAPTIANLALESRRTRSGSRHASSGGGSTGSTGTGLSSAGGTGKRYHSKGPSEAPVSDEYLNAITTLTARKDFGKSVWKPAVATAKLPQRQLALYLCGWSLAEDDLASVVKRWEKEHKHSQAACWLVFTKQHKAAIELLMRSKDEAHHMMSGMLAALTPPSSSALRNNDLREHCERLIVRLQDPHLRAMLTHLTVNDWSEVLSEENLPLRERLAIAFQFLGDKEISSYLRRVVDSCTHAGDIEGLMITGLSAQGMDILQMYLDVTGDVQSSAVLGNLNPSRVREPRVERWLDTYRDLLDQWKLFHYRCQLDIDRGKILQEAVQQGEVAPFEWTPRQIVLRCNYCNKPFDPPRPMNARPTACFHCGRPLPRCSICLMTLNIVHDSARNTELVNISERDTIDEALVFCQSCRHGGHASHILEWFHGEDGNRSHGTCPVASCQCRCADGF